nr:hypothetical protein [Tanacetum cinerariifolium]
LEFCAGEGGLKSCEWCGCSGVDWKRGEVVLSSWREKRLKCYSASYLNVGGTSTVTGQRKCRAYSRGCSNQRGIKEIGEEVRAEKSTELGSNDTEEMVNVLSSMEAANILTSGVAVASVSPVAGVPTVSGSFPTVSAIFTTTSVVTPYTRRLRDIKFGGARQMRSQIIEAKDKGKQKVVESEVPKKRKIQEQIDAQVAREMEEEFTRENKRLSEKLVRDSETARLHAEKELKMMIEGLDRSNEVIAKHL